MTETITKKICDICGKEMKGEFGYLKSKFTVRDYLGKKREKGRVDFKDVCDKKKKKINDVIIDTIRKIKEK